MGAYFLFIRRGGYNCMGFRCRPLSIVIAVTLVSTFFLQLGIFEFEDLKHLSNSSSYSREFVSSHWLNFDTCHNNGSVPENWCIDQHQTPRYIGNIKWKNGGAGPEELIKHYNIKGYEKCLSKKTVVFIGDSRVRFQFIHLASSLRFKRFMKCEGLNQSMECNAINPHATPTDFNEKLRVRGNNWNDWFREINTLLQDHEYGQHVLCDCHRSHRRPMGKFFYESQFLKRPTPFGEINLIYLTNVLNLIQMNQQYPPYTPFFSTEERCSPGECGEGNRKNAFQGDLNATLWNILPLVNATHAFINLGWEHIAGFSQQSEFSCVMQDFERQHPNIQLFLLSHPPPRNTLKDDVLSRFDPTKLKCNVKVLDRTILSQDVPEEWYWDDLHVLSVLNEEYNHQLMEKLCPL